MPRMSGIELARAISENRRDVPIVLLTGYIDDIPEDEVGVAGVREVLRKPASLPESAELLRRPVRRTE